MAVLLLVGNLAFRVWSAGWLDGLGGHKAGGEREPERLGKQVRPEAIRVAALAAAPVPASAASGAPAGATNVGARVAEAASTSAGFDPDCLEAGPFTPNEVVAAEAALVRAALPADSWDDVATDQPGLWIIYMGRYADAETLERKEQELERLRISPERLLDAPDLQPGLVLGRYASRSAADDALGLMTMRGLQSARVIAFTPPKTTHVLRVEKPSAALKTQLSALRAPALGSGFVRCGATAAAAPSR